MAAQHEHSRTSTKPAHHAAQHQQCRSSDTHLPHSHALPPDSHALPPDSHLLPDQDLSLAVPLLQVFPLDHEAFSEPPPRLQARHEKVVGPRRQRGRPSGHACSAVERSRIEKACCVCSRRVAVGGEAGLEAKTHGRWYNKR